METSDQPPTLYGADALHKISGWLVKLHELSTALEPDEFPNKVIESLKTFIPHQASYWGGGHLGPDGRPILHYLYLNALNPAILVACEAHREEVASATRTLTENAGRAFAFSAARMDDPLFTLIFGPEGITDILALRLFDEQRGLYHSISLHRKDSTPFSEEERGIFQAVAQHLIIALRSCHIAHINRLNAPPPETLSAKAIVNMEGVLHFAEDRLIASLKTEWPDWHGPWLPPDVWQTLSGRGGSGHFAGKRIVLTLEGTESLRLLSARPKFAIDALSAREREVARLFASGLKYKEIAAHLNLAPSTVRCQLNAVYAKLGINDKGALAEYLKRF